MTAVPIEPTAGPTPPTGKKPRLWPSIVLLAVGLVAFVTGIVGVASTAVNDVHDYSNAPIYLAPAIVTVNGVVGDYYVYQRDEVLGGPATVPGSSSRSTITTLRPDQVRVTGPTGLPVPTWSGDGTETVTRGNALYSDAVGFHVSTAGTYTVRIGAVTPASVFVAPSIGTLVRRAAGWLAPIGIGILAGLVGLVLFIIALVRRSTYKKRTAYAGPVPPYGGPAAPGQWIQPQSYAPQGYPPQPYYPPQGYPPQPGAGVPPGQWTPPPQPQPGTVPPQSQPPQPQPPQPQPPQQPPPPQPPPSAPPPPPQ